MILQDSQPISETQDQQSFIDERGPSKHEKSPRAEGRQLKKPRYSSFEEQEVNPLMLLNFESHRMMRLRNPLLH